MTVSSKRHVCICAQTQVTSKQLLKKKKKIVSARGMHTHRIPFCFGVCIEKRKVVYISRYDGTCQNASKHSLSLSLSLSLLSRGTKDTKKKERWWREEEEYEETQ